MQTLLYEILKWGQCGWDGTKLRAMNDEKLNGGEVGVTVGLEVSDRNVDQIDLVFRFDVSKLGFLNNLFRKRKRKALREQIKIDCKEAHEYEEDVVVGKKKKKKKKVIKIPAEKLPALLSSDEDKQEDNISVAKWSYLALLKKNNEDKDSLFDYQMLEMLYKKNINHFFIEKDDHTRVLITECFSMSKIDSAPLLELEFTQEDTTPYFATLAFDLFREAFRRLRLNDSQNSDRFEMATLLPTTQKVIRIKEEGVKRVLESWFKKGVALRKLKEFSITFNEYPSLDEKCDGFSYFYKEVYPRL